MFDFFRVISGIWRLPDEKINGTMTDKDYDRSSFRSTGPYD